MILEFPRSSELICGQFDSFVLAEKLVHIFNKSDDNHKSRTKSANQEHRHQHVVHDLQKNLHSKSVLPSTLNA